MHSGANAMLHVFEVNEAVIKMIIKGRSPTELLCIGCLTGVTWTQKSKSISLIKHQQIADIVTKGNFSVMSGTTSSFVEHLPFHFSLLQRRRQDCGKSKTNSDEHDSNCLDKFLLREPSDCVEKPGDTQSIYRET